MAYSEKVKGKAREMFLVIDEDTFDHKYKPSDIVKAIKQNKSIKENTSKLSEKQVRRWCDDWEDEYNALLLTIIGKRKSIVKEQQEEAATREKLRSESISEIYDYHKRIASSAHRLKINRLLATEAYRIAVLNGNEMAKVYQYEEGNPESICIEIPVDRLQQLVLSEHGLVQIAKDSQDRIDRVEDRLASVEMTEEELYERVKRRIKEAKESIESDK
jgi:hypothetical protein